MIKVLIEVIRQAINPPVNNLNLTYWLNIGNIMGARKDRFWSKREKSEKEIASKTKAELITLQEDLIKRIKENGYNSEMRRPL